MRLIRSALALALLLPVGLQAQSRDDSTGVRKAALDYIEGWYSGNAERMTQALHPDLVKRIMVADSSGKNAISGMTANTLIGYTRSGGGSNVPANVKRTDVKILDIFRNAASVRVDAAEWVDYLQLVRFNGKWVILNVLWEMREPTKK